MTLSHPAVDAPGGRQPLSLVPPARVTSLQIGIGWFPETPGGLDCVYYNLARHLPDQGVDVVGLVAGSEGVARSSGGRVISFARHDDDWKVRMKAIRARAGEVLKSGGADLIASHFGLYSLPLYDHLRKHPFVMHFHGPWALECAAEGGGFLAQHSRWLIETAVYRTADRFIVLSDAFARLLENHYRVPGDRIDVVPGGVADSFFQENATPAEARRLLDLPSDRPILLTVRRLCRRMGLEDLIDAIGDLREAVPDVLLLIGGKGPIEAELKRRIAERGLDRHVRMLGFIPDAELPLYYRAADLSVVPSVTLEGFGLVAAESLAAGCPALVTPVGGLPSVVADLSPGLVLEDGGQAGLADGLAAVLLGVIKVPGRVECRHYALDRFQWSLVAERTSRVYRKVLGGGR
ncbi:glycosyltransferase family 4 protein (plasmid) [Skermanella rosea]|uniref:glycosyltransferase family 4 protein n=1 Tax=Skermanella rosea TaxID=1817965 RepID=UPI0019313188|nr:glycosyltransferase family 4 protein [Skermanella rosea]UEM06862.1 glycosyltransferase family 4 protein [Skermanella rosea]